MSFCGVKSKRSSTTRTDTSISGKVTSALYSHTTTKRLNFTRNSILESAELKEDTASVTNYTSSQAPSFDPWHDRSSGQQSTTSDLERCPSRSGSDSSTKVSDADSQAPSFDPWYDHSSGQESVSNGRNLPLDHAVKEILPKVAPGEGYILA